MEKLSKRKTAVLDIIDAQIEELEVRLAKAQPLIDELASLRRTRATLLNERTPTGGVSNRTQLSMETVIQYMREQDGRPVTPTEIAEHAGVSGSIVRSHLSRNKDKRYALNGEGWVLIEDTDEVEE